MTPNSTHQVQLKVLLRYHSDSKSCPSPTQVVDPSYRSSPPSGTYLDQNKTYLHRQSYNHVGDDDDLLDFDKVISSQGNKTGLEL
ncbi:hypothetical protein [Absidia glauca]|uniref:Uncharacterized protein n=1 Tax=Absidia glauca TaxID=4829 RepID=A0A168PX66_ABSGL|nr:hypothetical protein [Absidia glauca]